MCEWRKTHIRIGGKGSEIPAADSTTSDLGVALMLPELLDHTTLDQEIASIRADGPVDTRQGHDAIASRGATAVIPPRKNAKPRKPDTAGAGARNKALRAPQCVDRII